MHPAFAISSIISTNVATKGRSSGGMREAQIGELVVLGLDLLLAICTL